MRPDQEQQHRHFLKKMDELRLFHAYLLAKFSSQEALLQTVPYFSVLPKRIEGYFPGDFKEYYAQVIDTWKTTKQTQVIGIHGHQGTGKTELLEKMLLDLCYRHRLTSPFSLTVLTAEEALQQAVPSGISGKYSYLDYQAGSLALTEATTTALARGYDFIFIEAPANTGIIPGSMDRGTSTMEALGKKTGDLSQLDYRLNTVFLVAGNARTLAAIAGRKSETTSQGSSYTRRPGGRIESLYQADSDLARVIQDVCKIDPLQLPDYDYRAEVLAHQLYPQIANQWQVEPQQVFIGEALQVPWTNTHASMMRRYSYFKQSRQLSDE